MPKILATNIADHRRLVRDALLDALDDLLDERDYEKITLSDVAARAGIARNTVYNYASDKNALLVAAVRRSTDSIAGSVAGLATAPGQDARTRLTAVVHFLLTEFANGTARVFALQSQVGSMKVEDQAIAATAIGTVRSIMATVLVEGRSSGEFRMSETSDLDLDLDLIDGVLAATIRRMASSSPAQARMAATEGTRFVLNALRA